MNTLFLNPNTWDLTLDSSGNIAMASNPYSLAQDAASAIKTHLGEVYLDSTIGIPYKLSILGKFPPLELLRSQYISAAMAIPEVTAAQVFFSNFQNRVLSGQVQITNRSGNVAAIGF